MPKAQVSDVITDQEIAFARLVLSGTMTDRQAAEAAGLNPATAAYTKSKPRVRAYMLEHRAAVREHLIQTETEELRQLNLDREQVLARLWEIANLSPEMTRSSITGQVKALAMIVAIQGLIPDSRIPDSRIPDSRIPDSRIPDSRIPDSRIPDSRIPDSRIPDSRIPDSRIPGSRIPDRRSGSSETDSAPAPASPRMYVSEWLRERQGKATDDEPSADLVPDDDGSGGPSSRAAADAPSDPGSAPSPAPSPAIDSNEFIFVHPVFSSEATPSAPQSPVSASTPDTRVHFSIPKSPFARRR